MPVTRGVVRVGVLTWSGKVFIAKRGVHDGSALSDREHRTGATHPGSRASLLSEVDSREEEGSRNMNNHNLTSFQIIKAV